MQRGSKWAAFATVLAIFIIYFVLVRIIRHFLAPEINAIQMPADAPAAWWHVLQSISTVAIATLISALAPLWLYLHVRKRRMRDLGLTRQGTLVAWLIVLALQGGIVWLQLHSPMGPWARAPNHLNPYALLASAIVAPAAAFGEEILFRGYIMDELKGGGFGRVLQVIISMLLFGAAHVTLASADWTIPVFTGLLGGLWSIIYLLGKRSLWPSIVGHMINDAVLAPSAIYMVIQFGGHY